MYIMYDDKAIDSNEIRGEIESNSEFKVELDLAKSSKREDILAYKLSIDISKLDKIMEEHQDEFDIKNVDEDGMFVFYMDLAESMAIDLEKFMPKYSILQSRAYKLDMSENCVKLVIAITHANIGMAKLSDVIKRLVSQVD
ncbi:MAG: hypothetical protein LBN09_07100 [Clostridioides sp.]|nr:hypothetical protein [Clostridioides sp.]